MLALAMLVSYLACQDVPLSRHQLLNGATVPVDTALEQLDDNLVMVLHFNADTQTWYLYSPDPISDGANTLTHMIAGQTYLLYVMSDQDVILNNRVRFLNCLGVNCWNQIVW